MIRKPEKSEHEWGDEYKADTRRYGAGLGTWQNIGKGFCESGKEHYKQSQGQFCQKCNAWRGSLGLEPTPDLYIQHIVQIFREVRRVLRKDGTVWLNIGDSYWGSGQGSGHDEFTKNAGRRTATYGVVKGHSLGKHQIYKPKDLCMIPAHVALALQADGWWLRSDIIWAKPNPMPESCTDRPTKSHEYVFLLTKSGAPQFWTHRDLAGTREKPKADWRWVNQITKDEVSVAPPDWKEKIICPNCEGKGRALIDLSYECLGIWTEYWVEDECPVCEGKKKIQRWKRINLWKGHDYFYDADAVREPISNSFIERWGSNNQKRINPKSGESVKKESTCGANPAGRNLRSVWTIATEPTPEAHFATFPTNLCEIAIKAGTSEKGCCPECGAPWTRLTEKISFGKAPSNTKLDNTMKGGPLSGSRQAYRKQGLEGPPAPKTIGWKHTCRCDEDYGLGYGLPAPCTVLDPFSGSGRALIVAKKLGRKAIGIDLKAEYLEMPLKKLAQERLI